MNKKLLLIVLSFCFVSCSVDNDEIYQEESPMLKNSTYEASDECEYLDAGPDNSITILESEAAAIESWDEVRKLYQTLLAPGVSKYGTFNPSINDLIAQFQKESIGDFTTTYTITDGECSDSVELTLKVRETLDSPCTLNAGPDNSITLEESEAAAIPSWDEVRKLYLSLLAEGVSREGTFDPSIETIISQFQRQRLGDFTTTYTITDGDCSDSVNLTVTVIEDVTSCDPVNAGPDNMIILKESEAAAIPSWDEVRKLYLSLLAPGVSRQGTFDPTIQEIINSFQARRLGDFTTTYTVGEGECTDSVELTVRVVQDSQSTPTCDPVYAGEDASKTLTVKAARTQGSTYGSVEKIFFRMLDSGVEVQGRPYSFNPTIDQLIEDFAVSPVGVFQTTLTIGEGDCQDSVVLTLNVVP